MLVPGLVPAEKNKVTAQLSWPGQKNMVTAPGWWPSMRSAVTLFIFRQKYGAIIFRQEPDALILGGAK